LEGIRQVHFWNASVPPNPSGIVADMIDALAKWQAGHRNWGQPSGRLFPILASLRVKKSADELRLLRHAANASAMGHREVLRSVHPGMREYEVMALVEYVFARNGCESVGYNSIVGSGPNSCILHYEDDRRLIQNGDIICMDAAGEYHGYSADVTRSFPANGKYSSAQRAIYQLVLAAQDAGIAECKPGNAFGAPGVAAAKVVSDGLIRLGIMKSANELGKYLPHGVSHYIGLDVHDAHGDNTLHPGYVLTVEPGIYIRAGSPCDPKWWNIGIRIEDDILVTEKEPENLSAGVPRKIDEIEALMKQSGIGKHPVGQ
jgi:Xaa-Pro aminopeptidase